MKDLAGDGVLALFGAPVSHEDDAERAVRAALRVAEDIAAYAGEVEQAWGVEGFGVRVGVATGPGRPRADRAGAARRVRGVRRHGQHRRAAAVGGRAGHGARRATTTRRRSSAQFDWAEPAELSLKGKAEPVAACAARGARPGAGRPAASPGAGPARRPRPRARRIREALDDVLAGDGRRPVHHRRGRHRQEPPGGRVARAVRGAGPELGRPPSGSRAAASPTASRCRTGRSATWCGEWLGAGRGRARAARARRAAPGVERALRRRGDEIYPYLGAMLGLTARAGRRGRGWPSSRPRRCSTGRSRWSATCCRGSPRTARSSSRSRTCTGPTRRRCSCSSGCSALAETRRAARPRAAARARPPVVARQGDGRARAPPPDPRARARGALGRRRAASCSHAWSGEATLPPELERRMLEAGRGQPVLPRGARRARSSTPGRWCARRRRLAVRPRVAVEVPQTVEKVILARIDRLGARLPRRAHGGVGARPAVRAAAARGRRRRATATVERLAARAAAARPRARGPALAASRSTASSTPDPGGRLPDARRPRRGRGLHRRAAEWLERQYAGTARTRSSACSPTTGSPPRTRTRRSPTSRAPATGPGRSTRSTRRSAHYRELLPLLERRGERQEMALVLFKLALALHTSLRFARGERRPTSARSSTGRRRSRRPATPTATLRVGTSFLPNDPDPQSAIAWPNIQLCMQLFDRLVEAWPERTIVPSLAERWEICRRRAALRVPPARGAARGRTASR